MKILWQLLGYILIFINQSWADDNPQVKTLAGTINGSIMQTVSGNNIIAFRGIRYAEVPTPQHRFKQAVPVTSHSGVFDATQDGPACPQPYRSNKTTSEDCLRLNVYTRELPDDADKSANKSVIVFIHPGAFQTDSGLSTDFGPEILLERDIVLVTINYRLGALGFLNIGDSRAPGNAGLKDQVEALHWIQQNIKYFSGNPNSVTLWGYGSGAWCVSLHMVSPLSSGLFHKAIVMSGAATSQSLLPTDQKNVAEKQANLLGCPTDNVDDMFDCLYTKPVEDYTKSLEQFREFYQDPGLIFTPAIESVQSSDNNEEPFLTAQPIDLIREGKANFVPLIVGVNKDELGRQVLFAELDLLNGNGSIYNETNSRWEEVAPIIFHYERNTSTSINISRELKSFYLHDLPYSPINSQGMSNLYSDMWAIFQTHRFERLMTNYSSQSVYNYLFAYPGCEIYSRLATGSPFGVSHRDDLYLLFTRAGIRPPCDSDYTKLNYVTSMIAHFAETGKPVNSILESHFSWDPSTPEQPKYLIIDQNFEMQNGIIYDDRINKLDGLFPLSPVAAA